MTQQQYDELIAEAKTLNIPGDGKRWAWNRAAILGLHPELSGIPEPPMSEAQRRQAAASRDHLKPETAASERPSLFSK